MSEPAAFSVSYRMSPGEIRRAGWRIDSSGYCYALLRQIIGYAATGALIMLAYCWSSWILFGRCSAHVWIPLAIIFVVFKLDAWIIARLSMRRASLSPTFGPHVMSILPDGLVDETPGTRHFYQWRAIERIEADEDFIYVIVDSPRFYLVSKRSFEDQASAEAFLSALDRHHRAARSGR